MSNANATDSRGAFVIAWICGLLNRIVKRLLRPSPTSIRVGNVVDLSRSKADLIAENVLLRHQLAVLKRGSKRPRLKLGIEVAKRKIKRYVPQKQAPRGPSQT